MDMIQGSIYPTNLSNFFIEKWQARSPLEKRVESLLFSTPIIKREVSKDSVYYVQENVPTGRVRKNSVNGHEF